MKRWAAITLVWLFCSCAPVKDVPQAPQEPEILVMPSATVEKFKAECSELLKAHVSGVPNYFSLLNIYPLYSFFQKWEENKVNLILRYFSF